MERAQERASKTGANGTNGTNGAAGPPTATEAPGIALELLVHGVGGATPEKMLNDPRTVRITGDGTAAVFRRADDADAEDRPADPQGAPVREAYVWCNLTSGNGTRALWLLLLPFMVVDLAHWMRPHRPQPAAHGPVVRPPGASRGPDPHCPAGRRRLRGRARPHGLAVRGHARVRRGALLARLPLPAGPDAGWWSEPGRRLALAAVVPAALTGLLWFLSRRTWIAYEAQRPPAHEPEPAEENIRTALGRPGFWYGRRLVARLRAAHTAAGLLTVTAALGSAAARHDREAGGPAALEVLARLLDVALVAGAVAVVWVVCRRGRSERRLDQELDARLVRLLPGGALALLVLTAVYAGWSRPGWRSAGRLPGDTAFGTLALLQGVIVIALAAVAHLLYRAHPDPRAAMRGFGGPAVAMLACALGGVMSGGVSQRVADWLDGTGGTIQGPPVLLTWQASVIPAVLLVVLGLVGWLARRTLQLRRAELDAVEQDYAGESMDVTRTRRIAVTRAMAALTDRAPRIVGITSAVTLALGAAALVGAQITDDTPGEAAYGSYAVVQGAADTAQALGSWLIGVGFLLFVTWGRRAYKDPAARRTIGILWDVGTFWPRAAHPFAPPCYAERAVPDLTWRMATWTEETGGRLVISGHSQGSVLAAAAAWQLKPSVRKRVALLTYGSPLERLYGRWFPAHFGPAALTSLHHDVASWRNLYRLTDPIGGPVHLPGDCGPEVDRAPLRDPLAYGRTKKHPLPAPILGHSDYQADPAFAEEREDLLARLRPSEALPGPRPEAGAQGSSGRSSG